MLLHSTRPGNTTSLSSPSEGPSIFLLSIRTLVDVTKYPYFLCCVRKGALFSSLTRDSRRRSPLQLYAPARLSRSLLTLNFPKLKSSHISSASSFYFLAEDTRHRHRLSWIRLIGPRSLPSSAYWRSSWLKVGESSGVISSSVNSCRGKLSKDCVHHLAECPGQCRSQERGES